MRFDTELTDLVIFLAVLLAVSLMLSLGCASTLEVRQYYDSCEVRGNINTGTTVVCSPHGVAVERRSVRDTAEVVLPAAVQGLLQWVVP